jgi:hypothetical protein
VWHRACFRNSKRRHPPLRSIAKSSDSGDGEQPQSKFTIGEQEVPLDGDDKTQVAAAPNLLSAASSSDCPMMKEVVWANASDGATGVTTAVGECCIGDVDDDNDDDDL